MDGPGVGKSTVAAQLFAKMKENGYSVELITEYAKELVYENRIKTMNDQVYLLGKQYHRIKNALESNEYLVIDSPLILSYVYFKYNKLYNIINENIFREFVFELDRSFNTQTFNVFLIKNKELTYDNSGRIHSEKESDKICDEIHSMLKDYNFQFTFIENIKNDCLKTSENILKSANLFFNS